MIKVPGSLTAGEISSFGLQMAASSLCDSMAFGWPVCREEGRQEVE